MVAHPNGARAPVLRGHATGASTLQGLTEKVGEAVDLLVHGRPRLAAAFVNPAKKSSGW